MAEKPEMMKIPPDSELGNLLAQVDNKTLILEKDGVRYAIYRVDDAEHSDAPAGTTCDSERTEPTHNNSRLADGYQSIPALREPRTWKEIEKIVRDERAMHHASKGV